MYHNASLKLSFRSKNIFHKKDNFFYFGKTILKTFPKGDKVLTKFLPHFLDEAL